MDTFSYLGQGFGVALSPYNLVTSAPSSACCRAWARSTALRC